MTALDAGALPVDCWPRGAVPGPLSWSRTATPGARILLQVRGIDAWNVSLRMRQALLCGSGKSREARLDADHRLAVLQRTHVAVVASTARALAPCPAPMPSATPTAVVAHHHPWFRTRAVALLRENGFTVVEQTDNGADALGAIIAEQPDLVLVGDRLSMMTTAELLSETALFSPLSVRAAPAAHGRSAPRDADHQGAVHYQPTDEDVARLFSVLCDSLSLRLLLHAVEFGGYDVQTARRLGGGSGADTAARLDQLTEMGLLVRSRTGRAAGVYCLADAESMERLLATLSRLVACRAGAAPLEPPMDGGGIDRSPSGHATTVRL